MRKADYIRLRVTEAEKARAEALAAATGRSVSDLLRLALAFTEELMAKVRPEPGGTTPRKTVAERRAEGTLPPLPPTLPKHYLPVGMRGRR